MRLSWILSFPDGPIVCRQNRCGLPWRKGTEKSSSGVWQRNSFALCLCHGRQRFDFHVLGQANALPCYKRKRSRETLHRVLPVTFIFSVFSQRTKENAFSPVNAKIPRRSVWVSGGFCIASISGEKNYFSRAPKTTGVAPAAASTLSSSTLACSKFRVSNFWAAPPSVTNSRT